MEQVAELQTHLAAAREETRRMSMRCAALETAAHQATLKTQQRESEIFGGETQQAVRKAKSALDAIQHQLDQKSAQLASEIQETSVLKKSARQAQEKTEHLQELLTAESMQGGALRTRIQELEASLKLLQSGAAGADSRLEELSAQTAKLKKSEKDLTAALRTMSQAEKSGKDKALQLERELRTLQELTRLQTLQHQTTQQTTPQELTRTTVAGNDSSLARPAAEEEEGMSARRASVPVGGLMGAAAARALSVAPGPRPQSFSGASPPSSSAAGAGVGVGMEITNAAPFIVKMLVDGGPAQRTKKILIGDTLTEIDGNDISFLHIDLIKAMLVGEPGSQATLKLLHTAEEGDKAEYTVNVVRSLGRLKSKLRLM